MPEKQHRIIKYINIHLDTAYEEMKATSNIETVAFIYSLYHSWCKSQQRGRAKLRNRVSLETLSLVFCYIS